MAIFSAQLFIGVTLEEELRLSLQSVNPAKLALFIGSGETQLQELHANGALFLGKFISGPVDMAQIEDLQTNILTLLQQFLPEQQWPFVIVPWLPEKDQVLCQTP